MNKTKLIGIGIFVGISGFVLSLYLYVKRQTELLKKFQYKILDFKINTATLNLVKGNLDVLFISISDIEVVVYTFLLDFYFNGEKVGYIEEQSSFIIPANGSATIPLNFTLNPQSIFGNVTDILAYSLRQKDASIRVEGYAKLKSGIVKANLPIIYETTIKEILTD